MKNVTLHQPLTQTVPLRLRALLARVVARARPLTTSRVRALLGTGVGDHTAPPANEQAAPLRELLYEDCHPAPHRWTPIRPGLRADAVPRLSPTGSAPRPPLHVGATTKVLERGS